ncbi:hypothetical protein N9V07_03215 [Candidatus Pelagibacter sp.]|nr:hypothetical protein [Candidatus Pelagibacter sp.]
MKKILSILVLSLLFGGNSYSEEQVDNALEKCADTQIAYGNIETIDKVLYENDELYLAMIKEKGRLNKSHDEYGVIYKTKYEKYWKDNPKPKYPKQETLSTYNFEDYKKAKDEWDKKEKEFLKPYEDELSKRWKLFKKHELLIKETAQIIVSKKLENLSLKEKAKTITNYTKKFIMCEEAYSKTPKGFMLEWGL